LKKLKKKNVGEVLAKFDENTQEMKRRKWVEEHRQTFYTDIENIWEHHVGVVKVGNQNYC